MSMFITFTWRHPPVSSRGLLAKLSGGLGTAAPQGRGAPGPRRAEGPLEGRAPLDRLGSGAAPPPPAWAGVCRRDRAAHSHQSGAGGPRASARPPAGSGSRAIPVGHHGLWGEGDADAAPRFQGVPITVWLRGFAWWAWLARAVRRVCRGAGSPPATGGGSGSGRRRQPAPGPPRRPVLVRQTRRDHRLAR